MSEIKDGWNSLKDHHKPHKLTHSYRETGKMVVDKQCRPGSEAT